MHGNIILRSIFAITYFSANWDIVFEDIKRVLLVFWQRIELTDKIVSIKYNVDKYKIFPLSIHLKDTSVHPHDSTHQIKKGHFIYRLRFINENIARIVIANQTGPLCFVPQPLYATEPRVTVGHLLINNANAISLTQNETSAYLQRWRGEVVWKSRSSRFKSMGDMDYDKLSHLPGFY